MAWQTRLIQTGCEMVECGRVGEELRWRCAQRLRGENVAVAAVAQVWRARDRGRVGVWSVADGKVRIGFVALSLLLLLLLFFG